MTIDELADTVARRIVVEHELSQLVLLTRELVRDLYHADGLSAKRIEADTVRLLTTATPYGFDEAQIRGMGLSENAIRKVVGRRTP